VGVVWRERLCDAGEVRGATGNCGARRCQQVGLKKQEHGQREQEHGQEKKEQEEKKTRR